MALLLTVACKHRPRSWVQSSQAGKIRESIMRDNAKQGFGLEIDDI